MKDFSFLNLYAFLLFYHLLNLIKSTNFKLPSLVSINFTETLSKYDVAVIEFFSSNDDEQSNLLESNIYNISLESERFRKLFNKTIYFAKVNASADDRFVHKFSIVNYPSLYVLFEKYESKHEVKNYENLDLNQLFDFIDS